MESMADVVGEMIREGPVWLTVTNIANYKEHRQAIVDIRMSEFFTLGKDVSLVVTAGIDKNGRQDDHFGRPQTFMLKGSLAQIASHQFRVCVTLPIEKATVRFFLRDERQILGDEIREI